MTALDATLKTLKGELLYLRTTTEREAVQLTKETDQLTTSAEAVHTKAMKELNQQLEKLDEQLRSVQDSNKLEVMQLRKKNKTESHKLQDSVQKYDSEVQKAYDELTAAKKCPPCEKRHSLHALMLNSL